LVQVTPIVVPGVLNIGDGYSRGVELELDTALTQHLTTQLSYTYDETKLTTISPLYVFPIVAGTPPAVGSALPGTPKSSLSAAIEYGHVPLAGGEVRFGIDAHYQSSLNERPLVTGLLHGLVAHQQNVQKDVDCAGIEAHTRLNEAGSEHMRLRCRYLIVQCDAPGHIHGPHLD
jgi:outer membrane receptor protein involved in Fe transport